MLDLKKLVSKLFSYAEIEKIEVYNQFSFQHELGIFLRKELDSYIIQFERNVSYFSIGSKTIKKEIDISIFNNDKTKKYAIELKHPLNGQYPEQMYSFVKDIRFMEQLRQRGFVKTCCVTLVSDKPFYQGKLNDGIYRFFREEYSVYGEVFKPTGIGKNEECITLFGRHDFIWNDFNGNRKYYIIEI